MLVSARSHGGAGWWTKAKELRASISRIPETRRYGRKLSQPGPDRSHPFDGGRYAPGTLLAERYRVVGLLGKGGMGEVYRADDLKLGQAVALKFLPAAPWPTIPSRLRRFHNEVRIARQVTHPNVCRVYDIGEVDGQHFLSMEYVDGEDLAIAAATHRPAAPRTRRSRSRASSAPGWPRPTTRACSTAT